MFQVKKWHFYADNGWVFGGPFISARYYRLRKSDMDWPNTVCISLEISEHELQALSNLMKVTKPPFKEYQQKTTIQDIFNNNPGKKTSSISLYLELGLVDDSKLPFMMHTVENIFLMYFSLILAILLLYFDLILVPILSNFGWILFLFDHLSFKLFSPLFETR